MLTLKDFASQAPFLRTKAVIITSALMTPSCLVGPVYTMRQNAARGLFHKISFRLKPQIGLYLRPFLQIFIVNVGEKVFNKTYLRF